MTEPDLEASSGVIGIEQQRRPAASRRQLGRAWLLTSLTNGTLGLVIFVVSPWANNLLGPEGRGRLTVVQLLPQVLADLSSIGLGFSIVHFGAARRSSMRQLLRWCVGPTILGTVVMFGIGQLLVAPAVSGHPGDERTMRIYLLICPLTAVIVLSAEALRGLSRFGLWNLCVAARGLAWPAALIVGVVGTPSIARIAGVHLCLLAFIAVAQAIIVATVARRRRERPATSQANFVRYGALSAVSTLPRTANAKLDQVVMTFRVPDASLGLYSAAVGWSAITTPFMRGLTGITMPHVSEARADQAAHRARQVVTVGLFVSLGLVVAGGAFTAVLWHLRYDDSFDGAFAAALILVPAGLLLEYNGVLGNVLRSLNRPGLVAVLEVVVLGASTAVLLAVLSSSTVTGPAIVSLATYLLASWLYVVVIARTLAVPARSLIDPSMMRRWTLLVVRRVRRR